MGMEITGIGQQFSAKDRRIEGSVNSSLRSTAQAFQTASEAQSNSQQKGVDEAKIQKIVEQIQSISDMFDRKLQFQINRDLNDVIVKVIDSQTDKVIREIPSAEIQKLQLRIKQTLGLLFDESI